MWTPPARINPTISFYIYSRKILKLAGNLNCYMKPISAERYQVACAFALELLAEYAATEGKRGQDLLQGSGDSKICLGRSVGPQSVFPLESPSLDFANAPFHNLPI